MRADDIDAVVALLAAAEAEDRTGEFWDAEDLTDEWVNDLVDLGADGLAVQDGGAVVGYATAIAPPTFRGAFEVYLGGRVHPRWRDRGLGRALLDWLLLRGAEVHESRHPEAPARLIVDVPATMPSLDRLVRRAGLTEDRRYFWMERPLDALPAVATPEGVQIVPFDRDRDDEVRRAHNAAFIEHHGSSERDVASWQVMFTGRTAFRPDLSTLAIADGAVVGYALVYVYESDTRATGYRAAFFGQIGVLPHARGRGLATAVVTAALRAAADRDCQVGALQVDSLNTSGALGLYERLGFRTTRTRTTWHRELPPVTPR